MRAPSDLHGAPTTARVAAALADIARLLALEPGNRWRARAYERAARIVATLPDLEARVRSGTLERVPGIGRRLASVVAELIERRDDDLLTRLRRRYPPGAGELARVTSLSRVRALHAALGIASLDDLRAACEAGRVRDVPGFGEATERRLLARIAALADRPAGVTLARAMEQAASLRDHLARHPRVAAVEIAGALRRRIEVIDALDLVVAGDPADVAMHAARAPGIVGLGETAARRVVAHRADGPDATLHVVPARELPTAWIAATGSTAHVGRLMAMAADRGLAVDPRGVRRGGRRLATPDEAAVYAHVGLAWVPPELREDAGELEAAAAGRIPTDLVRLEDVRGVVHCHTVASDGRHTVEEMARAAEARGLGYLTITDHSATASYANGLDVDRLRRQEDEIARVQERVSIRFLRGVESDILRDGALDYPDAILRRLDVVVASIHNRYGMDADEMTRRIVRAFRHPVRKIWGHALGRYVLTRPPFACRLGEVLDAAAETGTIVEVNGDPNRLDLAPAHLPEARARGIRFVVSADAHSTAAIANLRWGVDMARRGWLRRGDVVNTLDVDGFLAAVRPAGP